MKTTLKFTEIVPNARVTQEQVNGDMKSYKDIIVLERTDGGTRVTETWEYKMPYSILGKVLDALKVRGDLENYLAEYHRKAKESIEK